MGDAVAVSNGKGFVREVYDGYFHFAAVVAINGARAVDHSDAVLDSHPTTRAHLSFIAFGDFQK